MNRDYRGMNKRLVAVVLAISITLVGLVIFLVTQGGKTTWDVDSPLVAPESTESQEGQSESSGTRTGMKPSSLEGKASNPKAASGVSRRIEVDDVTPLNADDDLREVEAYIRERVTPYTLAIWDLQDLLQHILSQQDYELVNEDPAIKSSLYRVMETTRKKLRRGFSERGGTINSLGVQILDRGLAMRYSSKPKDEAYLCSVHRNNRTYKIWVRVKDSPALVAINSGLALATESFVQNASRELYRWRNRLK